MIESGTVKRDKWMTAIALLGVVVGCGSSGGTSGSGGAGGGTAGRGGASGAGGMAVATGEIVWLEDGTSESVPTALADHAMQGSTDTIEIAGSELVTTAPRTIGILIGSPTALGGTYMCGDTVNAIVISYTDGSTNGYTPQSCKITLTVPPLPTDGGASDGGAGHAVGTFTVVLTAAGGITKNLTAGTFDIPVTVGS
jgi:hypothetical protein